MYLCSESAVYYLKHLYYLILLKLVSDIPQSVLNLVLGIKYQYT